MKKIVDNEKKIKLKLFPPHWKNYKYFAVIDSNIIIIEGFRVFELKKFKVGVIIPEVVQNELDKLKTKKNTSERARNFSNLLEKELLEKEQGVFIPSFEISHLIKSNFCKQNHNNDEEIIANALYYRDKLKFASLFVISDDRNLRIMAHSNDVEIQPNITQFLKKIKE